MARSPTCDQRLSSVFQAFGHRLRGSSTSDRPLPAMKLARFVVARASLGPLEFMSQRPPTKPTHENPNAFKHAVGIASAQRLADELARVHPSFDVRGFLREAKRGLEPLELKPRIR